MCRGVRAVLGAMGSGLFPPQTPTRGCDGRYLQGVKVLGQAELELDDLFRLLNLDDWGRVWGYRWAHRHTPAGLLSLELLVLVFSTPMCRFRASVSYSCGGSKEGRE